MVGNSINSIGEHHRVKFFTFMADVSDYIKSCSNGMSSMSDGIRNLVDAEFSCIEDHT
jgi:hypothetical protein